MYNKFKAIGHMIYEFNTVNTVFDNYQEDKEELLHASV